MGAGPTRKDGTGANVGDASKSPRHQTPASTSIGSPTRYMDGSISREYEEQPVGISPEHKLGCEIQFDAECNCRDDDFEIDQTLSKVWGVGDKTRPK